MAKTNYSNRYYNDNKQNSIASSLLAKKEPADSIRTTNTTDDVIFKESAVTTEVNDTVAAVEEKKVLTKHEIVEVLSFEMKALCDVYVRTSPEKKSNNIDRILKKGETIRVFDNSGTWAKVEGNKYIMREFLG